MTSKYRNSQQYEKYKQICLEIWGEREQRCQMCGRFLREMKKHNFHHIIDRRKNLLNKDSIMLVCYKHHCELEGIKETQDWLDN